MLEFFKGFADIIASLVNFVVQTITGLIQLLINLPRVLSYITWSITSLPTEIQIFATLAITSIIVFLILGRNSG